MSDQDERAARLAAQLRANLRRRKEQARGQAEPLPDANGGEKDRP
ncbi:hypothetical protein GCM10022253_32530 [Sphingomonas endophytica]|uniref:Uncharacterized protein n=1 Tax=Sphingomonas endophytica TaxID=869719 RepID=A0ABR6N7P1_9SPHN|nr:hypothetical protein [Sphingomonas endophytica]MBB5726205.1 hypothetical protein [Sphingomonas endophytica]